MKRNFVGILKNKKYLLFILLMFLNLIIGGVLLKNSFAQNSQKFSNQKPIDVKVKEQNGSPLRIIIQNVDNSNAEFQIVNYTIQNISDKKIRAITFASDKITTVHYSAKFFESGTSLPSDLYIERENIRGHKEIIFSIDYVVFEDNTTWGDDVEKTSEGINGFQIGQKKAFDELTELFSNQNSSQIVDLLQQPTTEITPTTIDSIQTDKWQRGFRTGYKSVFSQLKFAYEKGGIESANLKLLEIKKLLTY